MSDGLLSFDARRLRVDLEQFDPAAPDSREVALAHVGRFIALIRHDRDALSWRRFGVSIALDYVNAGLLTEAVAVLGTTFVEPQRVSRDGPPIAALEARLVALARGAAGSNLLGAD